MNQGETTWCTIKFNNPIDDQDMIVAMYDENDTRIWAHRLNEDDSIIEDLGNNTYRITFPHSVTKNWVGKYYIALALRGETGVEPVNIGENTLKVTFKKAKISEEI